MDHTDGIAIIGMVGRFPGAPDLAAFWDLLRDGREGLTAFDDDTLRSAGIDAATLADPSYVKVGGVVDNAERFDAAFFGYSPREAAHMDPQHRVFLEGAWAALESAGYAPRRYDGAVGVYAGMSLGTYLLNNLFAGRRFLPAMNDLATIIGNGPEYLATRVSYQLDLRGPSIAVHAACATSLVATVQACQDLTAYRCDLALAGGVSIRVPQTRGYHHYPDAIFSPDGHCRAFDARAQGTVFGNGLGIVVLKRLDEALADGDTIYAVVKGHALNNDGAQKAGYTAPSVDQQAEVIQMAQGLAGVDPETIGYVETHGTATALGDPIEVAALTRAFGTDRRGYCALGSVKTNVGHLDAAAGVAGLIKATLALHHRRIPPSLHYERPNPNIDFGATPFFVNTELRPWPELGAPRRAGVSSFGIGGTNAHLVLEEAPAPRRPRTEAPSAQLLVLSARTETALEAATDRLANHLRTHPDQSLADVAFTLQVGREPLPHRRMLVADAIDDAIDVLDRRDAGRLHSHTAAAEPPPVVFMFPGQGAQYPGMGRGLYETEPVFRRHLDACVDHLKPLLGLDLLALLYPEEDRREEATEQLAQTWLTQPTLFAVEYAMAQQWMAWGVRPEALIGHSIGESVAACLAGVFTLADALTFVARRGRLMQDQPTGSMLAIQEPAATVTPYLADDPDLALAVVNSPRQCVASGPHDAVDRLQARLEADEVACTRLRTSHAFHSSMMEPMLAPLTETLRGLTLSPPQLPFISNLSGTWITEAEATDPAYWALHVRHTVRFADGLETLMQDPARVLLEVGPWRTLSALRGWPEARRHQLLASMRHPMTTEPDRAFVLQTAGRLWQAGVDLDLAALHTTPRRRLPLPTYPFEGDRHWIDPKPEPAPTRAPEPQRRADPADWGYVPSWQRAPWPQPPAARPEDGPQTWLAFVDRAGLGNALLMRLFVQGHHVIRVEAGADYAEAGELLFTIDPHDPTHYDRLLDALQARRRMPQRILHLWTLDAPSAASPTATLGLPLFPLLFLGGALGRQTLPQALHVTVVTAGLFEVVGGEPLVPERATVLGPARVLPKELPGVTCRCVDLPMPAEGPFDDALVGRVLTEALTAPQADEVVAHRGGHRWLETFAPTPLAAPSAARSATLLRERGTYLITGGLGAVGLVLAEHLARTLQARLVLLGRTGLPDRARWDDQHLDATRARIDRVRGLEALGAEVLVLAANVADEPQMAEAIAQACTRFGTIHGIIHAAGVPGDAMMVGRTAELARPVLDAKVQGTRVLATLCRPLQPDFLLLCSSFISPIGDIGLADYTGANAFLDAFAQHQHRTEGLPTYAVGWEAWAEAGMAAEAAADLPDALRAQRHAVLQRGLTNAEGADAFVRALAAGHPHLVLSTTDFNARVRAHREAAAALHQAAPAEAPPPATEAPAADMPDAPQNPIEQAVAETWQQLLGVDRIGRDDDFFDLGGNSLLATQLNNRLRQRFDRAELSLRSLFDHPTVARLAAIIARAYPEHDTTTEHDVRPIRERLADATQEEQPAVMTAYLNALVADTFSGEAPADGRLDERDTTRFLDTVIFNAKTYLGLTLYHEELRAHASVEALAAYLLREYDRMADLLDAPAAAYEAPRLAEPAAAAAVLPVSGARNPSMVFILSAPRSGSTLFRLMLSAHPRLFCPPELNLLTHPDLGAWAEDPDILLPREGLVMALMELRGLGHDEAHAEVARMIDARLPMPEAYRLLQAPLQDRLLVDKTPAYTLNLDTLHRAEARFERPRYLYLSRHPYAMIDSYVRARFDRVRRDTGDPFAVAESYWTLMNQNALTFGETVGPERFHHLRFEDLVQTPEAIMQQVCGFLDLPLDPTLLTPYEHSEMFGGPGDPNIFRHTRIEPALGEAWRTIRLPRPLGEATQSLAQRLAYTLPPVSVTAS